MFGKDEDCRAPRRHPVIHWRRTRSIGCRRRLSKCIHHVFIKWTQTDPTKSGLRFGSASSAWSLTGGCIHAFSYFPLVWASKRLHPKRTLGGDRHYRHLDRPVAASRAESPRGGRPPACVGCKAAHLPRHGCGLPIPKRAAGISARRPRWTSDFSFVEPRKTTRF